MNTEDGIRALDLWKVSSEKWHEGKEKAKEGRKCEQTIQNFTSFLGLTKCNKSDTS
jgi:hypothetical protein